VWQKSHAKTGFSRGENSSQFLRLRRLEEKGHSMLRDKSLIPLSRQHQHALALCVRIERASPIAENDLPAWRAEIARHFEQEISIHFAAEELVVFPAARGFEELVPLVEELIAEHARLREWFSRVGSLSSADLVLFVRGLSEHIRKEERELFERMQRLMSGDALAVLGTRLEDALKGATQACALPTAAGRLRAKADSSPAGAGSE
jgi:hemerythrin-like domain-containing protein